MNSDQNQDEAKKVLTEKLISLGAFESEVDQIIHDVTEVIAEKFVEKYGHDTTINPETAPEKFQAIAEEMWADYFNYIETN